MGLLLTAGVHAQVQRTIVNTGFEQPALTTGGACLRFLADTAVPGWITTEPVRGGLHTTTCQGAVIPGAPSSGRPLEFWAGGFNGLPARAGTTFVELNAFNPARLRQDVCLLNGETVNWSVSHRGRSSNTVADVMEFKIGAIPIARMATAADGTPRSVTPLLGTADVPMLANNGWVDYSGQFAYTGAAGTVDLGFEAISATGGRAAGNFLDNIQINLRPFVEFAQAAYTQNEGSPTGNRPQLLVAGTVPAGGMTVPVTITGGTATLGLDYLTASGTADVSVFIPAGVYDGNSFPLPITIVDDGLGDHGETITFNTPDTAGTGAPYNRASLQSCGGVPLADTTSTISEDPDPLPRIQLTKALSANRLAVSDQFLLRIDGTNGRQTTTTGAGSAVANGTITVGPAQVGSIYTLSEVMAAGSASALSAYTSSISCTNTTPNSATVLPSGSGTSFTLTVTVTDNISCVFTNDVASAPAFIDVVKTVTSGQLYANVGDVATYSYAVTNTGPTAVNTLTVTDNRIATVACPVTTLGIGGSTVCTGSYTVTQADIDDVLVTNIATASARNASNQVAIDTDDAVINRAFPAMTADKSSTQTSYSSIGQVIPYTYVITNTGNTTISALTVNDNRIAAVSCPVTTLAVGANTTCTANYTITQADMNTTSVTNVMTATGTPSAGTLGPVSDSVTITNAAPDPTFTIAKTLTDESGDVAGAAEPGEQLAYTITATNTSDIDATGVLIVDAVPANTTFVSASAGGTLVGSEVRWTQDIPANSSVMRAVVFQVADPIPVGATQIANSATVDDPSDATPPTTCAASPCASTPLAIVLSTAKTSDVGDGTAVLVGDVITYTVTTTSSGGSLTQPLTLTDTFSSGLTFGSVTNAGAFTCNAAAPLVCTLPTGTPSGIYAVSYTVTVNASATNSVSNTVVPSQGSCADCSTINPLVGVPSTIKTSDVGDGTAVQPGDVITYTLSTTVTGGPLTQEVVLTDTLGGGLTFGAVTVPGAYAADTTGAPTLEFTLPVGTPVGTYAVSYTATVDAAATTAVSNSVTAVPGICLNDCSTSNPLVGIDTTKTSDVGDGRTVQEGDVLIYTLTTTVTNGPLTQPVTLTDTLGNGLTFGSVITAGGFTCNAATPLVCTLPAGTPAGIHAMSYTAIVDATATTSVSNAVVPSAGNCTACSRINPIVPTVTYRKSVDTEGPVTVGEVIGYTLSVEIANSPTTAEVTLTDTLGTGLDFVAVTNVGAFNCNATNPLVCTLPVATAPGTYAMTYQARVNGSATGTVDNSVVGNSVGTPPGCGEICTTSTPTISPVISVAKSSDPAAGTEVQFDQTIAYTLTVTVSNSATVADLVLVDTPDEGLTIGAVPNGCSVTGPAMTCTLPAQTPAGVHTFLYSARVNAQAADAVSNRVTAAVSSGLPPDCTTCSIAHPIAAPAIRVSKTASVRDVKIGDLVRYTLIVENLGDTSLVNGSIVDMPAAGISYVEDSLQIVDGDNRGTAAGQSPLRLGGVDVAARQTATLTYLMRVGAGVRPGVHINQALVHSSTGTPISNLATAQVELVPDPLLDDALIFGTVFDDRDGDGWQDSAALSDVRVQGGFAPGVYVAHSTLLDRGAGSRPEPDASAPMLRGIAVGTLSARQSEADPMEAHQVVIRQTLSELAFTNDFVLTSAQGVTVRMDAAGNTTVEKTGGAAKHLSAAAPTVQRRVSQGEGGFVVDYVVRNEGIDERGIPGVRIASVEGLLIETDQFGRYHLAGTSGGPGQRGRNFILKVDPSTLPAGAVFTTRNTLVRRITPGLPVRFDWGVKLPVQLIEGATEQAQIELGDVFFAPGSAEVRPRYQSVIEKMAAKVREYRGGEVIINANGDTQELAFDRAVAVKEALVALLDAESAKGLVISARGKVDDPDSLVVGVDEGGALLGIVLFDTDKATIRPQFEPLLNKVAAALDRMGGGAIAIVGHTDVRASYDYNVALGMRRARAVYEAIAQRLSPEVRAKVRVEASNDPTTPLGPKRESNSGSSR